MITMLRPDDSFAPSPTSRWLVSTDWLADHLRDRNLTVVDGSYFLPMQQRDAHAEYRGGHIPGAVFFDIEAVSDHSTELPHMLPGPTQFGEVVGSLGIGDGDTVVVYDSVGLYSAARVWWTFRLFGAKKVYILDGGLPKWKSEGRPLETGDAERAARKFTAEMNVSAVALLDDMRMAQTDDSIQIVDARSPERFAGTAPEPRPGLRPGAHRGGVHGSRRRSRQADHYFMRLRRHRRDPHFCARIHRQGAEGSVRRLLGGMGLAPRPSGRTRLTTTIQMRGLLRLPPRDVARHKRAKAATHRRGQGARMWNGRVPPGRPWRA
jgi:3-mercaptopyruvate sulfurtransferase SseA